MADRDSDDREEETVVRSDLAPPSRPGGHDGVRQPIPPESPTPPPGELPPDPEIVKAVRQALTDDGRVDHGAIEIVVRQAVAELSGEVALEFERTLAEALAGRVPGVLTVRNFLTVRE